MFVSVLNGSSRFKLSTSNGEDEWFCRPKEKRWTGLEISRPIGGQAPQEACVFVTILISYVVYLKKKI